MEGPAFDRRRSRLGHRQSLAAGFLLAVAFLAWGAQGWLATADEQPDPARSRAAGNADPDAALPGEDPPEVDSVRAPARPPVKEQAARKLEVGSSGRVTGLPRPSRPPLVPRQQQRPVLPSAPRSADLERPMGLSGASKAGPLARSAPRAEPVRLPSPEPELPAPSPSRQERTIVRALPPLTERPAIRPEQEVLPVQPSLPAGPPIRQEQGIVRALPPVTERPAVRPEQEVLRAQPLLPAGPPIRQEQGIVKTLPPLTELPAVRPEQEVLPARPSLPESPSSRQQQEVVTVQPLLIQPEPGPEPSALMRAPGRELLAPSALDLRRLRRTVAREAPQRAIDPSPADPKDDGGTTVAATPRPVRLPKPATEVAESPPVRLPPAGAEMPERRPVRLPPVDPVVTAGPAVSPEPGGAGGRRPEVSRPSPPETAPARRTPPEAEAPQPRPAEPAGEAVVVTDDVQPPPGDRVPPSKPQEAVGRESPDAAKPGLVGTPQRPLPAEAASVPVVERSGAAEFGPLRLTMKFPPPPKTAIRLPPQPQRPVVAVARLNPEAADSDESTAGADAEEGVAFASDSAASPQQPLRLSIKYPPRNAKPADSTNKAAGTGPGR